MRIRECRLNSWLWSLSLVAFPLLLLWRSLFAGEAFFWGTPLLQFVPWQSLAAAMWRGGHLPLWNPLVGCGAPLAANYQTAAFYPLNALYLFLPAEVALSWTVALHLVLAGWGMVRWGRAVGLAEFPALLGALALEGSGFLVARAALFPSMALVFPWLAVWLWRGEVLARSGQVRDALWLGLALGLGLMAGHAQTTFYGGLLLAAYVLLRIVQEARNRGQEACSSIVSLGPQGVRLALRRLSWAAFALAVGLGLAAVQLLPTAELMLHSQRATGVGYDFAMTYSFWPWRLITFLAPDFFGNPGRGDYWGYATYWEDAGYVGVLPLLMAAWAILALRGRREDAKQWRGMTLFWTIAAVCSLLLALGQYTPVFPFLFRSVPGFDLFQAPARWLAVVTVALAALASLGAQQSPVGRAQQRRLALWAVMGLALMTGGLLAPRIVPAVPATFGPATARLGGILALGAALLSLQGRDSRWRAAVALLVMVDLLTFGWPLLPSVDRSLFRGATQASASLGEARGQARIYWQADPLLRSRDVAEYRVKFRYLAFDDFGPRDVDHWWALREALLPNTGMLDDVASANSFDPLLVRWTAELLDEAVRSPHLLRVLGVTHVASDQPWPGGEAVYAGAVAALYHLPDSPGRAWIVPSARRVDSDEALVMLADPAFDPAVEVLLDGSQAFVSPPISGARVLSPALGSATLHDAPNRVTIRAALNAPGYLVVADTWYPGWQAAVDGEPVTLLRANHAFRAVWLEAGEHTVEMVYRPASVLVGGILSLGVLALVVTGLAIMRGRASHA